jgi:signal recognition particle subunit SRP54
MKNMGSLSGIIKLIPGMGGKLSDDQLQKGEEQLKRVEAMINSMTPEERRDPDLLSSSPSRRKRIAKGAGYGLDDVSKLVKDFQKMRSLMQQMGQGSFPGMGMPGMGGMGGMFGGNPTGGAPTAPPPGWRGYNTPSPGKKKKKDKKKKGFGTL